MKNQKGITLVALVITIIVLLILAGVSISLVLGQNGVLTQASTSVVKNNEATAKQDIKMAVAACYTAYMAAWAENSAADVSTYITAAKIKANLSDQNCNVTGNMSGFTYTYTGTDKAGRATITFSVSDNGTITGAGF